MTLKNLTVALFAAAATVLSAGAARASFIAFEASGSQFSNGAGNDGLFFTPNIGITITTLGYYDCNFAKDHPVALFDATTQQILASTSISGASNLVSSFRYESISPTSLTAGHEYAVVGLDPYDAYGDTAIWGDSMGTNSDITFNGYFYNFDSTLTFPTYSYGTPILGPNFQFVPTGASPNSISVPEPTAAAALLPPAALLSRRRRV